MRQAKPRRQFGIRVSTDGMDDLFLTIEADTPAAAAIQVYVGQHGETPGVVEVSRRQLAGCSLTTFVLSPLDSDHSVRVEVEDRGLHG